MVPFETSGHWTLRGHWDLFRPKDFVHLLQILLSLKVVRRMNTMSQIFVV